jgi:hypothetical protein
MIHSVNYGRVTVMRGRWSIKQNMAKPGQYSAALRRSCNCGAAAAFAEMAALKPAAKRATVFVLELSARRPALTPRDVSA